jgi:hypothetical protein
MGDEHEGGNVSDRGREMDGKENEIKVEIGWEVETKGESNGNRKNEG